ncbi:MAG: serine dehydratase [Actinomycetia bacterium]|nr:serine dehydratase [Actinomycetes bacterium]
MRGPSSSHSAASARIGRMIFDLCGGTPSTVSIEYDSEGSLATTHKSQGTDIGLYGGLLGWQADDARLANSPRIIREQGTKITLNKPRLDDPHPNTYRIGTEHLGEVHSFVAISTGGGMIEVLEIDGFSVTLFGDTTTTLCATDSDASELAADLLARGDVDSVTIAGEGPSLVVALSQKQLDLAPRADVTWQRTLRPVLPVRSRPNMAVPFNHAGELPTSDLDSRPLSDWAIEYECARGGISESEVLAQADRILSIMRSGVEAGLAGTEYDDRILGVQSGRFAELSTAGSLLDGGLLNSMIAYVTALMEAKSAMHIIVAAPTAGACATFPGALLATIDSIDAAPEAQQRALLTGGLVGVFVTNRSSFAAEVGGCQAETGAGAAMAAAALAELGGGSAAQSLSAASQSIQNVLGLICDPVGGRVEAPCLGRNVAGAANALCCANMALAGYDHLVPLDEALDAHASVGALMARELRCTGLGGLAITPTSQRIELDLGRTTES